jgi:hypothetical protein
VGGDRPVSGADLGKTKFSRKTTLTVTHTEADKGFSARGGAIFAFTRPERFTILWVTEDSMPTVKTTTKKAAKTAVPRAAKKVTLGDLSAIVADIGKAHQETEKGLQKLKKTVEETSRQLGDLGNKFGDIAEQMLTPALVEKFEKLTFPFTTISRNIRRKNKEHGLSMELDALLENGTKAMVVEVKSKLKKEYVDDFVEKMEIVRRFADLDGNTRQFYGAMGAMTADEKTVKYALDKGFYMIMPSGEDVKITEPVSEKAW